MCGDVATIAHPSCLACLSVPRVSMVSATGSRKVVPIEPRSAFQLYGSAELWSTITPALPAATAERMMAPRFPGSCTASGMTMKSFSSEKMMFSDDIGLWEPNATILEGDRNGLTAAIIRSEHVTRLLLVESNCAQKRLMLGSLVNAVTDTSTVSIAMPDCCASVITRSPSSTRCLRVARRSRLAFLMRVTNTF